MKALLVKSETDPDMIEIRTKKTNKDGWFLWAVVHADFIQGEDIQYDFDAEHSLEIEIKSIWK